MKWMICFIRQSLGHLFAERTQEEIRNFIVSLAGDTVFIKDLRSMGDNTIHVELLCELPRRMGRIPISASLIITEKDVLITGTSMVPLPLRIFSRFFTSRATHWLEQQAQNRMQEAIA
jgi:hypothetical protein